MANRALTPANPRPVAEVNGQRTVNSPVSSVKHGTVFGSLGKLAGLHENPLKHHLKELLEAISSNNYTKMNILVAKTPDHVAWVNSPNAKLNDRNPLFVFCTNTFTEYAKHLLFTIKNAHINEFDARLWNMIGSHENFKRLLSLKRRDIKLQGTTAKHIANTEYILDLISEILTGMRIYYNRQSNYYLENRNKLWRQCNQSDKVLKVKLLLVGDSITQVKADTVLEYLKLKENVYRTYTSTYDAILERTANEEIRKLLSMRPRNNVNLEQGRNEVETLLTSTKGKISYYEKLIKVELHPHQLGGKSIKNRMKKNRQTRRL